MRSFFLGAGLLLLAGAGAAQAESGGLFKGMFGGGGGSSSEPTISTAPRAYDPNEVYCPPITIADGAAAVQAYAGGAGDTGRLRHQITFARLSRECAPREGGGLGVKVGVQLRALLGPAGASGTFDAPLTIAIRYGDTIVISRSRRVAVSVPAGAAQGNATVIESDLTVPADKADAYAIVVSLGGQAAHKGPAKTAKHRKPATDEATAAGDAPAAGQ